MTWSCRPGSDNVGCQLSAVSFQCWSPASAQSQSDVSSHLISFSSRLSIFRLSKLLYDIHNITNSPSRGRKSAAGFVGDHKSWETPDPIPNSEVKPRLPMILLCGKVGHRRLLWARSGQTWTGPFRFCRSMKAALPAKPPGDAFNACTAEFASSDARFCTAIGLRPGCFTFTRAARGCAARRAC